ncbi:MAG: SlyX family protein [Steroidobacteraceae bacterium]
MDNELLERLELKLAYLERASHELSDVVYRQQRELNELRARVQALSTRVAESSQQQHPYNEEEERPPHY